MVLGHGNHLFFNCQVLGLTIWGKCCGITTSGTYHSGDLSNKVVCNTQHYWYHFCSLIKHALMIVHTLHNNRQH